MNYKTKLLIIKLLNLCLVVLALAVSYAYFHKAYMGFLDNDIAQKINQAKQGFRSSLHESQQHFKDQQPTFKAIHNDALTLYRQAKAQHSEALQPVDLEKIKQQLISKYQLSDTDLHLFLINREYTVFNTTYKKDIGFNLAAFPETVKIIDNAFSNNDIHISDLISRDPLDMQYKMYSYAQADDTTLLELGFIDKSSKTALFKALKSFSPDISATLFHIIKDNDNLFYFPVKENNLAISKETLYSSQYRFQPNDPSLKTDPVMQAFLNDTPVMIKKNNAYHVYASVYNLSDADIKTEYEKIVLKFDINQANKQQFLSSIQMIFLLTAFGSVAIMFMLYRIMKREIEQPIDLMTEKIKRSEKIPLNELPNQQDEFYEVAKEYNLIYDKLTEEIKNNERLLLVDHLTQIHNRKAFDLKLAELLSAYKRYQNPFSLFMFDIDNFKLVNDTLGHHGGDQLLRDFTTLIASIIRESDFFYRTGGEEFTILFPHTAHADAQIVSEKVRAAVESHFASMREHPITLSGGLCTVKPYDTRDTLFKCADKLLYRAKADGKNRVYHVCQPDDTSS